MSFTRSNPILDGPHLTRWSVMWYGLGHSPSTSGPAITLTYYSSSSSLQFSFYSLFYSYSLPWLIPISYCLTLILFSVCMSTGRQKCGKKTSNKQRFIPFNWLREWRPCQTSIKENTPLNTLSPLHILSLIFTSFAILSSKVQT